MNKMVENIFRVFIGDKIDKCVSELINLDGIDSIDEVQQLQALSKKQRWTSEEKDAILQLASRLLLVKNCRCHISLYLPNILPELYLRARELVQNSYGVGSSNENISILLKLSLDLDFDNQLLQKQIYFTLQWVSHQQKAITEEAVAVPFLKLLHLAMDKCNLSLEDICNLKDIYLLTEHPVLKIKWYAVKILAHSLNVLDTEFFIKQYFNDSIFNQLILEDKFMKNFNSRKNFLNSSNISLSDESNETQHNYLDLCDFRGNFLPIFNVLLEYKDGIIDKSPNKSGSFVLTDSAISNMKSLVLALLSDTPVLISGGIGCGKTIIIEYLASCLGRNDAPDILKLQLGDQTDSKSLLGTYICAERPGEFRWQPGTLTQAVEKGSWLLLEDIDTAPMDIISTLISLIKSKSLSIPGHGEEIKIAPGFQMFATTRTDSSGFSKDYHSTLHMFSKLCHQISMEIPTKEEMSQIVLNNFSSLASMSLKMIDVFCMVSTDTSLNCNDDVMMTKLPVGSRSSSPRELFKWCSRISKLYHLSDGNITNEDIFLNAMQCFCSSIPVVSVRCDVAYSLGAKLGLNKDKVDYYLNNYKPNITRNSDVFQIGSTKLRRKISQKVSIVVGQQKFAFTRHSLRLLEDIAVSVKNNEPVLLVGETGGGKTSCIQLLAEQCGRKVNVINMSQQSDIADLLGGFKPLDTRQIVRPLKEKFEELFIETYSQKQNAKFLAHVNQCFNHRKWIILIKLLTHCCQKAIEKEKNTHDDDGAYEEKVSKWKCYSMEVMEVGKKISEQDGLVFSFIEGSLVKSIQTGDWILLDEINLATPETLEYLSGLLDGYSGSMILTERGDIKPVKRHKSFRMFACMNPATDVGKKDLPHGIRNRFTEIFVDEINDSADLKTIVAYYLKNMHLPGHVIDGIVEFYLLIKCKGKDKLMDTVGARPHYSLRTLCRGLEYAVNQSNIPPVRALYEGLCMSFLTQLDRASHPMVINAICKHVFHKINNISSILSQTLPKPAERSTVYIEGYWLNTGTQEPSKNETYVLTRSVKSNLKDLARIVAGGKYPVLLQGETSVGKTSLITYLSQMTGNHCVRINNHEHTDIQEYIGCYGADENGSLVFKEGVLVTAMRLGNWIILDELNLAPTDVLEALNRLLDDNRELFIAETQETIKAHPRFMLFATQNPPGHYGGRKMLSRAFRNRFVELHFGEIPSNELEEILHLRCHLPMSYCKKFVKVMLDLQLLRRNSAIFAGKHSFMTLRDLFRWAERYRLSEANAEYNDWEQCICEDGFMLIAGRCRREDESMLIKGTLERNFKRKIDLKDLYGGFSLSTKVLSSKVLSCSLEEFKHIVWTQNMKRLVVLVGRALQFGESVLLVGETGCGKTTACQLFSYLSESKLFTVNCHMHTESADFIGGLRPVRIKESGEQKLFEWCDGPLVDAMRDGSMFLIDEISLADDSVLERLNSVLEMERILVLSERGEVSSTEGKIDIIKAAEGFRLVATMNPGGDFGKKELSPALRNRFTEIWCSPSDSYEDLKEIIEHNVKSGVQLKALSNGDSGYGLAIINFLKWFKSTQVGQRYVISIRDILCWVQFINCCCPLEGINDEMDESLDKPKWIVTPEEAYIHGCCLILIDSIGSGNIALLTGTSETVKEECIKFLKLQVGLTSDFHYISAVENYANHFGIKPFLISRGSLPFVEDTKYSLNAKTTRKNTLRLLRSMQLSRPILLEGSPGVGKTSLVIAIARIAGYNITRINLSEETDISDLFGADLPIEGGQPGQFAWRDGPLLKALKAGHWVIFDEMNLASQSVLEGLNACFDHRAEVFVPELNKSFIVQKDKTKIFACQNPLKEGGGRKGLPKSFLNRFTKVYVDAMSKDDLVTILHSAYSNIGEEMIVKMVYFNDVLHKEVVLQNHWGRKGGPWEFNVRDLMRWCELMSRYTQYNQGDFVDLIYSSRMRELNDKEKMLSVYKDAFQDEDIAQRRLNRLCNFDITSHLLQIGFSQLAREACSSPTSNDKNYQLLRYQLPYLEYIMKCVEMNWMSILVGSESSGKNAMIGVLAKLSGKPLHILSMNSEMDTSDFIGGFEQLNLTGHLKNLCHLVSSCISDLLAEFGVKGTDAQNLLDFENVLAKFLQGHIEEGEQIRIALEEIENIVYQLRPYLVEIGGCLSTLDNIEQALKELKGKWEKSKDSKGQFEWTDGVLVRCLKNGHWLLIENVNFCSSSILDRLNGLLEPNGVLTIDECGDINGEIPTVKPHPNFRIFLSMDPRFGEISRAMRNRGVEIYIPSEGDGVVFDDVDTELFVKSKLTHHQYAGKYLQMIYKTNKVKRSSLMKASTLCSKMICNGVDESNAVKKACLEVFCQEKSTDMNGKMTECITTNISKRLNERNRDVQLLPSVNDYIMSATLGTFQRICLPLCVPLHKENISLLEYLLTFERITLKDMKFGFDYIRRLQVNGLSSFIDKSETYHNTQSWKFSESSTICRTMNNTSEDGTLLKAKRYFFMLVLLLKGFNDILGLNRRNKSIMEISKDFYEGKITTAGLPHQSVMYLYRLYSSVVELTQSTWWNELELETVERYVQHEEAFYWFTCFVEFCKQEFARGTFTSQLFSVSRFALHWKWVYEKFFNMFHEKLPDEVKVIVKQVDRLLGHDSLSYLFHNLVTSLGLPMPFLFEQQFNLLENLSDLYNGMISSKEDLFFNPCCTKIIESAKEILIASSFNANFQEKVDHLREEMSNNSKIVSEKTNPCSLAYRCLYALRYQSIICKISSHELMSSESIQVLLDYGFNRKIANLNSLVYLSLLKDYCDEQCKSSGNILSHLKSNLYQISFPDVSLLFSDSSNDEQVCQQYISPCAPMLNLIMTLNKCVHNDIRLHIPLIDVTDTLASIKELHRMLWSNMIAIMSGEVEYMNEFNLLSCIDILRVVEGIGLVWKNDALAVAARNGLLQISNKELSLLQTVKTIELSLKDVGIKEEIPTNVRNILLCLRDTLGAVKNSFIDEYKDAKKDVLVGSIACLSGLLLFTATNPSLKYDPIEELELRLRYLQNELTNVESELNLRYHYEYIWSGVPPIDLSNPEDVYIHLTSNPERVRALLAHRKLLLETINGIEVRYAARPQHTQYNALYQDLQHFGNSIGNTNHIISQMKEIGHILKNNRTDTHTQKSLINVFQKVKTWVHSVNKLIMKLESSYPLYCDITLMPLLALKRCVSGFNILLSRLKQKISGSSFKLDTGTKINSNLYPSDIFDRLIDAPRMIPCDVLKVLLDETFLNICKDVSSVDSSVYGNLVPSILNIALLNLRIHVKENLIQKDEDVALLYLNEILSQYYMAWQQKKQVEFEESESKDALYRFKSKLHCNELTDEERLAERQKQLFPSFDNEFTDLVKSDELGDGCIIEETLVGDTEINIKSMEIDELFLYQIIKDIYLKTEESHLSNESLLKKYFCQVLLLLKLPQVHTCTQYGKTAQTVFLMLTSIINDLMAESKVEKGKLNIYTDHDIQDVLIVKNMLLEFQKYIQRLLSEFEEHPALVQIDQVIQRILSFSVTSPVMKFLTGLEFLLKEAQNWETYAGSHVSLRKYLEEVTSQVFKWRKLELAGWQELLEISELKIFNSASKWFFHFFNLLEDFQQGRSENGGEGEFLEALKVFFEHSSIGDFKGRIELIQVILKKMEMNDVDKDLQNAVWNIFMYYKQFLPAITQHMIDQRKPVEKELKDYVKIAKWNDINFYAMKQAVEKSHRTLNKYVCRYEKILMEPITQFLKDPKFVSNISPSLCGKDFHFTIPPRPQLCADDLGKFEEDLYVSKVGRFLPKMSKHISHIVEKTAYGCLVANLDGFTGDIICGIKEFNDVDIFKLPKEKQKAARNNLQERKRKALASLFKELKAIGLSYRKGISINDALDNSSLPQLEEINLLKSNVNSPLIEMITSCNKYFFECQAKQSMFYNALCAPSTEIGPREISRFKGLTEHLMNIAADQRRNLYMLLDSHKSIGTFIHCTRNVKKHGNDLSILPPQKIVKKWLHDLESILNKASHTIHYFKMIVYSCPSENASDNYYTPFTEASIPKIGLYHSNSQVIQDVKVLVVKSLEELSSLRERFCALNVNERESPLLDWNHWKFIENAISSLNVVVERFNDVIPLCSTMKSSDIPSIVSDIIQLKKECSVFTMKFYSVHNDLAVIQSDCSSKSLGDALVKTAENTIERILISIQRLVKSSDEYADQLENDGDENVLMKNGHLVPLLTTKLYSHINVLDVSTLDKAVQDMVSKLQLFNSDIDRMYQQAFFNILPLLEHVSDLIEYYVFNMIMLHRTSCKLLYVLYGLFTDLVTQGYCIPPEEDGEVCGEGATEFEDIQGGGLGEGEGAKDVSEQIESEDQVEDTKHENSEEKEQEEGDDIAEEKEGIEMSDDFDSKLQDMELNGDDESSDEDDKKDEEEEEPDKQMGEVDGDQQEKVDDKMWGDSDVEDEDDNDKKGEKGPGAEAKSESELVAKDDNEGAQEGDEKKEKENQGEKEENDGDEIDDLTKNDFSDDEKEENVNDKNEVSQQPDDGFPDDLELDKTEENEVEEEAPEYENEEDMKMELPEETNMEEASEEENGEEKEENVLENEQQEEKIDEDGKGEDNDKANDDSTPSETQEVQDAVECAPTDSLSSTFESATQQPQQNESNDDGVGRTESESTDGHLGSSNAISRSKPTQQKSQKRKDIQHSKDGRTLENEEMENAKRRKVIDGEEEESEENQKATEDVDTYQHMDDNSDGYDQLAIDAATMDQLHQLSKPQNIPQMDSDVEMDGEEGSEMTDKSKEVKEKDSQNERVGLEGLLDEDGPEEMKEKEDKIEDFEMKQDTGDKDRKSDFFTIDHLLDLPLSSVHEKEVVLDNLRKQLESELISMTLQTKEVESEKDAMELWLNYEKLTSELAHQLCEQLRLVLEPTLASKMRGDYRTGKRLNMRKVIPYIASQFRKDKIWLRRTKKSKRQYQIILAVDDSSSMADNHSKQLAFESLAVISNALQWLEAGKLAVCSFGEEARLIHSFDKSFSEQAGASILQQFTFEQKNTKIAQLVNMCSVLLNDSKSHQRSNPSVAISQLLLILSDGRGIFLEGKETVQKAVRTARDAGIFIVFLIMDDPKNRDSILDIKVPIFKPGGGIPEIKSYMEEFPFPFYVLLRDINSLPMVLSESLKQWFELVTQPT